MRRIRSNIAFIYLFVLALPLKAQMEWVTKDTFLLKDGAVITLACHDFISEFYVQCQTCKIEHLFYSLDGGAEWNSFQQFSENENPISSLVFLPHHVYKTVQLKSSTNGEVTFTTQHLKAYHRTFSADPSRNLCEKPQGVLQSEWRIGLPLPKPNRNGSQTRHIVLHHSGADNFRDNYADVVRAYYLFHLEGNHWSDIGYNYLIDPYGVLYYGRDPLDSGFEQDEVTGAHFCGKNGNTMGVCIIGNYDEIQPTENSLLKLTELLAWKVVKDGFDFLGSSPHPYPSGPDLVYFASHNLGCSTLCPGIFLLATMDDVSSKVVQRVSECLNASFSYLENSIEIFPNPVFQNLTIGGGEFLIKTVHIYNEKGMPMLTLQGNPENQITVNTQNWKLGLYYLLISNGKEWISKKIFKL
jgi:hypothetical protein